MERGEQTSAIARYEAVLKYDPNNVVSLNNLAYLYQQLDGKKALEYAERAYKLAPNHYGVMDTYGWILMRQQQSQHGLELLAKATELAPHDRDVRYHYAAALARTGDCAGAAEVLKELLATEDEFSERRAAESLYALLK